MARKERTRNFTGRHSSFPYKTEGQHLCADRQTATCVQIVNPKYQKMSTSESILFRDAVESSTGNSGRQRKPLTFISNAECSYSDSTLRILRELENDFMDVKSVTTWTQMVSYCKEGKKKKLHTPDLPASV